MNSLRAIPLKEIRMKQGINIGGFQYRIYQTGPAWELHLHPVGGYVSLHHVDSRATHYVHLSLVEGAEGFVDYGGEVSSSSSKRPPSPDGAHAPVPETQGLISNQIRVPVESDPLRAVQTAEDLGSTVSPEQKQAKEAHFGVEKSQENVEIENPPVKKKRGRPRKVRPEDAVNA